MAPRPSMASTLILLGLAGCSSQSEAPPKAGLLPWEKALANGPATAPAQRATVTKAAPPTTPADFFAQARGLATQGDLGGALRTAEEGLVKTPESRDLRLLAASLAQEQAAQIAPTDRPRANPLFFRSAELIRAVRKQAGKDLPPQAAALLRQAVYNEACCFAVEGKTDRAMESLGEAFLNLGATNVGDLDTDADLVSLRDRPDFAELKRKIQARPQEGRATTPAGSGKEASQAPTDPRPSPSPSSGRPS